MQNIKVFVNAQGQFGNPVGILVDEKRELSDVKRQHLAAESGFSEVVFVNDFNSAQISIYNPMEQVGFAGHAVIGVAWYIAQKTGKMSGVIQSLVGKIHYQVNGQTVTIITAVKGFPQWNFKQYATSQAIEQITMADAQHMLHTYCWAWKVAGITIRARTFASDWGIVEDQANGSGTMLLAQNLQQEIEVEHGLGSLIFARPVSSNNVELSGFVAI